MKKKDDENELSIIKYIERMILEMLNIYYRVAIILGTISGSIYKMHQIWVSEIGNPVEALIKVIGVILVVMFIFTPSDLLQNEDR